MSWISPVRADDTFVPVPTRKPGFVGSTLKKWILLQAQDACSDGLYTRQKYPEISLAGHPNVQTTQDNSVIQNLTQNQKITVTPLTLDPSDVQSVAGRIRKSLIFQTEDEKKEDIWDDRGWILIIQRHSNRSN